MIGKIFGLITIVFFFIVVIMLVICVHSTPFNYRTTTDHDTSFMINNRVYKCTSHMTNTEKSVSRVRRSILEELENMYLALKSTKVPVFATSTTLLAAVLEGHQLPTCEKLSFGIFEEDLKTMVDAKSQLEMSGKFKLLTTKSGNFRLVKNVFTHYPFIDIMVYSTHDGEVYLCMPRNPVTGECQHQWDSHILKLQDVKPMRMIPFNDTQITIPNKPETILSSEFGTSYDRHSSTRTLPQLNNHFSMSVLERLFVGL